jgi:hypothetical protein
LGRRNMTLALGFGGIDQSAVKCESKRGAPAAAAFEEI